MLSTTRASRLRFNNFFTRDMDKTRSKLHNEKLVDCKTKFCPKSHWIYSYSRQIINVNRIGNKSVLRDSPPDGMVANIKLYPVPKINTGHVKRRGSEIVKS